MSGPIGCVIALLRSIGEHRNVRDFLGKHKQQKGGPGAQFTALSSCVGIVHFIKSGLLLANVKKHDLAKGEAVVRGKDAEKKFGTELIETVPSMARRGCNRH